MVERKFENGRKSSARNHHIRGIKRYVKVVCHRHSKIANQLSMMHSLLMLNNY